MKGGGRLSSSSYPLSVMFYLSMCHAWGKSTTHACTTPLTPVCMPAACVCVSPQDISRPAGLKNLGNTCYVNSVLQCLFANTAFRSAIYAARPPLSGAPVVRELRCSCMGGAAGESGGRRGMVWWDGMGWDGLGCSCGSHSALGCLLLINLPSAQHCHA